MNLNVYAEAVREDLANIAAVGDEATGHAADLLVTALEPALARRLQEALVEATLELSAQLERGTVEVRVAGEDLDLVYVYDADPVGPGSAEEAFDARITLRLPESLKARLDAAAAASGVSANTWLVQALTRALELRPPIGGLGRRRLTGYGRS